MPQNFIIPDTWNTLEEFAQWFKNNGYPMRVPANMQIYVTDSTYSCVVFRQDVYQAELYLVAPNITGHKHSHDFEYISSLLGGHIAGEKQTHPESREFGIAVENVDKNLPHPHSGQLAEKSALGTWHKIDTFEQGCIMYTLQQWSSPDTMSSAVLDYKGEPIGPLHTLLLQGYKDIAT